MKKIYKLLVRQKWQIGFILGGYDAVLNDGKLKITWVKSPYKDRWFADPFILDVTSDEIILLVEEFPYSTMKGVISKLTISRHTYQIVERKTILELDTHLSFPNIYRLGDRIYIYPENCRSGKLDIYEYSQKDDSLILVQTICNDVVWDSCITDYFGKPLLFTARKNDYFLDIYSWDDEKKLFTNPKSIEFKSKTARMAGQLFEYNGEIYYPSQNCTSRYGQAVDIRKIKYDSLNNKFDFEFVKEITSTHATLREGLHTLNEYKGIVVVDVIGYEYPIIGKFLHSITKLIKRL